MDTLRLVEVAGDGSLVLMTGDGRRFSLAVDEQVRSAVRRSRNGTHAPPAGPDRPGPREVQARIRAGADAQEVATQTGLDVDFVRRFEGPVLAERAHVADLARKTPVDRGGDPTLDLERVVVEVLTGEGHDVDDIGWDSRRVDGTRWQVVVTTGPGDRTDRTEATWGFDTSTRSLEPVDAEAERLTGVERRRRLSAVRENVFDVERPSAAAPVGRGGTVELLDALARQRGRRPVTRPAAPGTGQEAGEDAAVHPAAAEAGDGQGRVVDGRALDGRAPDGRDDDARDLDADRGGVDEGGPHQAREDEHTGGGVVGAVVAGALVAGAVVAGTVVAGSSGGDDADRAEDDDAADRARADDATDEDHRRAAGLRVVAAGRVGPDDTSVSIEPDLLSDLELDQPGARAAGQDARPARQQAVAAGDRRSRRRRSAVPSWDEIVFGAKREDG
ncbi:septation protein SepH [Aquipuribacter hungaricus]|uniref:Septation protein SepH n=1 Tax=Aquipuribacter hungaricus TaxID=545624 RepID=A0ABV7WE22_9MICO